METCMLRIRVNMHVASISRAAELAESDIQSKAKVDAALASLQLSASKLSDLKRKSLTIE